jgi:hypothetical protein
MELYILIWLEDTPIGDMAFLGAYKTEAEAEAFKKQVMNERDEAIDEIYKIVKTDLNQVQNIELETSYRP